MDQGAVALALAHSPAFQPLGLSHDSGSRCPPGCRESYAPHDQICHLNVARLSSCNLACSALSGTEQLSQFNAEQRWTSYRVRKHHISWERRVT